MKNSGHLQYNMFEFILSHDNSETDGFTTTHMAINKEPQAGLGGLLVLLLFFIITFFGGEGWGAGISISKGINMRTLFILN